jgi:AcrR family transcriptional regulator
MTSGAAQRRSAREGRAASRVCRHERREAIVDAALGVFASTSYAGRRPPPAREAGISEPILYRHFPQARLYSACLDAAWGASAAVEGEPRCSPPLGLAHIQSERARRLREQLSSLWVVALTESGDDVVIAETCGPAARVLT